MPLRPPLLRRRGCDINGLTLHSRPLSLRILTGASVPAQSASNGFWQAQSIYQIITDRFFDGNPSNNNAEGTYNPSGSSGTSVHGGDFKGIEQKLDYIKSLGATAIW